MAQDGAIATLADTTGVSGLLTMIQKGERGTPVEKRINLLSPVSGREKIGEVPQVEDGGAEG